MDSAFDRMKELIFFNLDSISNLIDDAEEMRETITETKDEKLRKELLSQVSNMEQSIKKLIEQTQKLFEAYKQIVRGS